MTTVYAKKRLPTSVYRLQLHKGFNLQAATKILPYLKSLGIDGVYCSPYFKAYSKHGYDVIDSTALNPDVGSQKEFDAFCERLQELKIQHVIDVVPNHMGIRGGNGWWDEVLEQGPNSRMRAFFDINWDVEKGAMKGKMYLPILGDTYGWCLDRKEIQLREEGGRLFFQVYDYRLPLAPKTYKKILTRQRDSELVKAFSNLAASPAKRAYETERAKRELQKALNTSKPLQKSLQKELSEINASNDRLHDLLEEQYYRLCCWRVSGQEINYRRFFNFNDLAAVAIENEQVLNAHHRLIFDLAAQKKIQGVRVDHPDGLLDPLQYFTRLSEKTKLPIFLEKILDPHEKLPENWPVEGTVGYDYLNKLNALFIQKDNEKFFNHTYKEFIGQEIDFHDLLYEKKKYFALTYMRNEIHYLGQLLDQISDLDYWFRDFTRNDLTEAILEVVAAFPVYRTYIDERMDKPSRVDTIYIQEAFANVHKRVPHFPKDVLHFLEDVLLLRVKIKKKDVPAFRHFILRFQQFTSPMMARGLEDICFYLYNRFISLNEVGGHPTTFGISSGAFHQFNGEKRHKWPYGILTTSTHDTKRSEDVRMRLNAISEMPDEWHKRVFKWERLNRSCKRRDYPERNTEYFIYQMLIGLWPEKKLSGKQWRDFKGRLWGNLLKSIREMRETTNWDHPNEHYEKSVKQFLFNILDPAKNARFFASFEPFVKKVIKLGYLNSLSMVVLKLGSPGIVDVYQGNETWQFTWVDPDNRHDVDYEALQKTLEGFSEDTSSKIDHLKHEIYWKGLTFRSRHPSLFLDGKYIPLKVTGNGKDRLIAFMRQQGKKAIIILAGRFFAQSDSWAGTHVELPLPGTYQDIFTHQTFPLKNRSFPVEKILQSNHFALLKNF